MKMLLLIIPLLIGCSTEVVADVDELYREYTCDVAIYPYSSFITNFAPEDSMLVVQFTEGYIGDASYTKETAEEECVAANNVAVEMNEHRIVDNSDSTTTATGNVIAVGKQYYCQCERSN